MVMVEAEFKDKKSINAQPLNSKLNDNDGDLGGWRCVGHQKDDLHEGKERP